MESKRHIVCVGGGTGTFVVLSGLKKYVEPWAIVSMADSGGSTGRLRDEFGVLPPGDIRRALVALASENKAQTLRRLFSYRFDKPGSLYGHNFGNLFLTVLSDILGNEAQAIKKAGQLLEIKGRVFPVTLENTQLLAEYESGRQILGEGLIDRIDDDANGKITQLSLIPPAHVFAEAQKALLLADLIVLGPGDLFTSLIPNLLVEGVSEAILESGAKLVYIVNLVTKKGQTTGFSARDHLETVEKYLGQKFDSVIINNTPIPNEILQLYKAEGRFPVADDLEKNGRVVRGDFLSEHLHPAVSGDATSRSLLRHAPDKLARVLLSLSKPL